MAAYDVDKLMDETRRVAVLYRANTGQTLPIGAELAKYDALKMLPVQNASFDKGIDFIGTEQFDGQKILLKSRVIFDEKKSHYRLGRVDLQASWDCLFLILYTESYHPYEIYSAKKTDLLNLFSDDPAPKSIVMSLAKYKTVASLIWSDVDGLF